MKTMSPRVVSLACISLLFACGTDTGLGPGPGGPGDAQTPPTGDALLDPWLATLAYRAWACESGPMDPRPNSVHGRNRVCSNNLVRDNTGGEYPVGAASVKELFDSNDQVIGHTVSRHIKAGKTADTWYWYEKSGSRVAADGVGVAVCNGCHSAAGSDASHEGHDYVFIQVKK